jgi:HSP20 family molecular chaperone IbpA
MELSYQEYAVGNYERSFIISEEIDRDGIVATVKDGVLDLTLPKSKKALARKIPIKAA